jgi:DNA-binding NtrC family response regulator
MTMNNAKVLVVDDDPENCFVVAKALEDEGYQPLVSYCGSDALEQLESDHQIQLVLLDIRMPGMDGVEVLGRIREKDQELPVVIVSAFEQVSTAVKCMRLGAYDYLTKPLNIHELKITVANTFRTLKLQNEVARLRGEIEKRRGLEQMVGSSPALQHVAALVQRVAQHDISVLVTGESGTGKEVVSEAIHALSPRRDKPFVCVDCTALPEHLLESELFGYERGAFTGALERKPGRFELAQGGTLFLDEIGNLPLSAQMKLLRVLQERQVNRLGGKQPIAVDVRVLSATNANLKAMMQAGIFREELFHRLNEFSIHLPALRDREGDVEMLAAFFLHRFNAQFKRQVTGIGPTAMDCLRRYPWPGNVRELHNAIKRAVVLAEAMVEPSHLPPEIRDFDVQAPDDEFTPSGGDPEALLPLKEATQIAVARIEKALILKALARTENNKMQAAKLLRIDYKTLFNKLKEHKMTV